MKNITILGSTGSIGVNTLNVIDNLDQDYNIVGLSTNTSANTILSQIKKYKPEAYQKGNIKDINGKVVGVHDGIINFTIGQRRGIKVSDKEPLYVIEINAEKNEIIVGSKKYLAQKKIKLKDLNILCKTDELDKQILVKVRSTGKLLKANIDLNKDKACIELLEDEYGISPGQACVFYSKNENGDKVLGGGWIAN